MKRIRPVDIPMEGERYESRFSDDFVVIDRINYEKRGKWGWAIEIVFHKLNPSRYARIERRCSTIETFLKEYKRCGSSMIIG